MASRTWIKRKKVLFSQQILAQTLTCVLCLLSLNMLYSQEGFIVGPRTVCGGCHEYSLEIEATGEERFESLAMRVDMMQMTLEAMFDHLTMRWGPQ